MEQLLTLRSCIQKLDFEAASGDASLLAQRADGENNKQPVWISRPYKLPDFLAPDGVRIPAFALYQGSFNSETCMVHYARGLAAGYRHIVTQLYNEKEGLIAHVLKSARIPRDRVFITSIIRFSKRDIPTTVATIRKAAFKLSETRPINLMLADPIQDPVSRRRLWQALEQAVEEGIVTYIGVANYNIAMLEELKTYAKIWPPRVNSLELHPWRLQEELVNYCKANNIIPATSSPTARDRKYHDATLCRLAEENNFKHPAQLLLRYALQKGWLLIMNLHIKHAEGYVQDDRQLSDEVMRELDCLDL